jgi:hypothetical protein
MGMPPFRNPLRASSIAARRKSSMVLLMANL